MAKLTNRVAVGCSAWLDRDLFERDVWNVFDPLLSVLNRNAANLAFGVKVEKRVLVQIACLCHVPAAKLDVKRVSVFEVLDLHG